MQVTPGTWYVVTTDSECTVTDANGKTLCTAVAGEQKPFLATTMEVTLSDEGATVTKTTFKHAALALGLFGGGVTSSLPPGYTRLEFLESTGEQYVNTGLTPFDAEMERIEYGFRLDAAMTEITTWRSAAGIYRNDGTSGLTSMMRTGSSKLCFYFGRNATYIEGDMDRTLSRFVHDLNYKNSRRSVLKSVEGVQETALASNATMGFVTPYSISLFGTMNQYGGVTRSRCRIWGAEFTNGRAVVKKIAPCIAPNGIPCMYDLVSMNECANVGSSQFIAGLTLSQARELGKLPAGTTLTVSLPVGYDADEGVANALEQARENGCVLTIQTYEVASAATTFAIRRVWVRKLQAEHGGYVDANSTRWQVEWCVDVIGAAPESLGYERFRSVEVAAEYWGLTPVMEIPEDELTEA